MFNFLRKNKPSTPEKLFFTTDIHCHIVPGIDDGSPSPERSVELVRRMKEWGIERIIASPHVTEGTFENNPDTIAEAMGQLRAALTEARVDIDLSNSAEYRLDDLFHRQFQAGLLMPLPNDYLLVENSFIQEPWGLDQTLFDLKVRGFRPILAHPERYTYYHNHLERYKKLHDEGTLFQVNLLSLAGHYGKTQRKIAEWMMERDMIDFLGSDLHNHRHADAIERYLASREYCQDRKRLESRVFNDREL